MERNSRSSRDRDSGDDRGRSSSRDRDDSRGSERGGRDRGREDSPRRGRDDTPSFSYRARSAESVKKRADAGSKDFDSYVKDNIKLFTPNDGPNTIRILPPTWPDPEHFGIDIYVHYGVGPDQQSYLCLHKMKGEDCPICEERIEARKNGEDEDYVRELEPARRSLFYLVDRDKEQDGVQAWSAPFSKIDQAIVKVSIDRKTNEVLPIDHPDEGYDVEFDKKGKGIGTQYTGVAIARRDSPLGNKKWLAFAQENPLPDILVFHDYEHIKAAFGGGAKPKPRDDDDDSRSSRSTRGRSASDDESDARPAHRGSRDAEPESRGRGRDRDDKPKEPEYTWESVHEMTGEELEALIDAERLEINPNKADSDDELADWICEDLKLEKASRSSRRDEKEPDPEDSPRGRLASMREGRGR